MHDTQPTGQRDVRQRKKAEGMTSQTADTNRLVDAFKDSRDFVLLLDEQCYITMLIIRRTGKLKMLNRITCMVRNQTFIDDIQSRTHQRSGIINNILDISKIKTGELRLEGYISLGTTI